MSSNRLGALGGHLPAWFALLRVTQYAGDVLARPAANVVPWESGSSCRFRD